jgi:hypothetical protein
MSIDLSLLAPDAVTPALTAKLCSLAHDLDRIAIAAAPTAGSWRRRRSWSTGGSC